MKITYVTCDHSFIYHGINLFNISHINVLSSSDRSYPFSFYFCKYVSFMYSVYNDIFHVNNVTSVFDSNLYTGLLDNDNKFFTVILSDNG